MRTSLLGSVSMLCFAFVTPAWAAPDEPAKFGGGEESASPASASGSVAASATADATDPPSPRPITGAAIGALPPPDGSATLPTSGATPPTYDPPPPPPPPKAGRRSEWGLQFRLQAAPMGENASSDAGMGGLGFSLRPRPSPSFAIDFGLDFMGGRDFNGDRRSESALVVNPMLFLNPRNKVQIYVLAGLGLGRARVQTAAGLRDYRYIGANAGGGVEFRFWQHFALSGDVVAFLRDRTDAHDGPPEYVDRTTGRYTDTSAGAVIRLGGTYYW